MTMETNQKKNMLLFRMNIGSAAICNFHVQPVIWTQVPWASAKMSQGLNRTSACLGDILFWPPGSAPVNQRWSLTTGSTFLSKKSRETKNNNRSCVRHVTIVYGLLEGYGLQLYSRAKMKPCCWNIKQFKIRKSSLLSCQYQIQLN